MSRWSLLIFRSHVQRSRSNHKVNIFGPLHLINTKLGAGSKWSVFIFRSHVQRSRSNYSFEPSVLSTLYFLIHWLPASYRFCFYREDKPEFCAMGGIDVSETFFVFHALFFTETFHFMYTNKCSFYNFMILIWFDDGGYICSHCWYVFIMSPNVHVM